MFRMTGYDNLLGAFWFMRSLFVASLLLCYCSCFIEKISKYSKRMSILIVAIICGVLGGGNFIV